MMRFDSGAPYRNVFESARRAFLSQGISLLRADDYAYHADLFLNVQTYMYGCGIGVAIFDRIQSDEFNPNVSLEVGYMMALGKPVCILKDRTLKALPTDIVGRLYINFDPFEPSAGLEGEIRKWLIANDLCLRCVPCSIEMRIATYDWQTSNIDGIVRGFELFSKSTDKPKLKGIRRNKDNDNVILDFEGNEIFARELRQLHNDGYLNRLTGIEVVDVKAEEPESVAPQIDYIYQSMGSEGDEFLIQYCFLEQFEGCHQEAEEARKVLPPETADPSKCAVYGTITDGLYYFHSNFRVPGYFHPTKMTVKHFKGLKNVYPLIIYDTRGNIYLDKEVLLNHIMNVRYIFNRKLLIDGKLPFDTCGATKIEYVSF